MQRRVDGELALGDVEHAEHVDVQLDEREILVGEEGRELTEQDEPDRHGQLDEDADLGGDDPQGGAPPDERHRPEHEPVARGREDRLEVGDDPVGVADRIGREEHGIGSARLDAAPERVDVDRAVHRDETTDALEGEAEAERDRWDVGADRDEERIALGAVGQTGGEQADGGDRESGDLELQDARVARVRRVVQEEPAAHDGAGIDLDAHAVRRDEAGVDVERPCVPGGEREAQPYTDTGEREREGPERGAHRDRRLDDEIGRGGGVGGGTQREPDLVGAHGTDRQVRVDADLEPGAAVDPEAGAARPRDRELQRDGDVAAAQQAAEEAVEVVAGQHRDDVVRRHAGHGFELALLVVEVERRARLAHLDATGPRRADEQQRCGRLERERDAVTRVGHRLAGRERDTGRRRRRGARRAPPVSTDRCPAAPASRRGRRAGPGGRPWEWW